MLYRDHYLALWAVVELGETHELSSIVCNLVHVCLLDDALSRVFETHPHILEVREFSIRDFRGMNKLTVREFSLTQRRRWNAK